MLSRAEVQRIAKLARIGLRETDIPRFIRDLGSIVGYFDILHEVDVSAAGPHSDTARLCNRAREDIATAKNTQESQRLLEMAPEIKDGYLKVKSIL